MTGKEENADEAEAVMPQAEGGIGAIDSKEGDACQGYGSKCNGNCSCDTAFAARSPFHCIAVPAPMRLHMHHDQHKEYKAGSHMKKGPIMPYGMVGTVSCDVQGYA